MRPCPVSVATVQSSVGEDVRQNGRHVRRLMRKAKSAGARIAHFPEGALSGYVKRQIRSWYEVDWGVLAEELTFTRQLADQLGLWVVIGCNYKPPDAARPHNSLHVIDDQGALHGRYDKRICSPTELRDWYDPGDEPLVFDVEGVRFGTALCIEVNFPHLFAEYEALGVDCMLLSSYSSDPMFALLAQAHAATNCYWLSFAVPEEMSQGSGVASRFIAPDGRVLNECR